MEFLLWIWTITERMPFLQFIKNKNPRLSGGFVIQIALKINTSINFKVVSSLGCDTISPLSLAVYWDFCRSFFYFAWVGPHSTWGRTFKAFCEVMSRADSRCCTLQRNCKMRHYYHFFSKIHFPTKFRLNFVVVKNQLLEKYLSVYHPNNSVVVLENIIWVPAIRR